MYGVCWGFLPECVGFLTKIIQTHSVHATSFTLHSMLSVIIWQVTHSFCTAFSAHSHITQNGIHSHSSGPHSVRIHASAFAIIRIHSQRTAFSDTPYAIHSSSFITVYIHFRPNSHSKRATFNIDIIHVHSRSYTNCHIHVQPHSRYIHRCRWRSSATTTYTVCLIQPYTHSVFIRFYSSQTAFIQVYSAQPSCTLHPSQMCIHLNALQCV